MVPPFPFLARYQQLPRCKNKSKKHFRGVFLWISAPPPIPIQRESKFPSGGKRYKNKKNIF